MANSKDHINALPLLSYIESRYELNDLKPFKGYICIFVQHLLGSNIALIKSLEKGGISKTDFYIIGKAYSSNEKVVSDIISNGYKCYNPIEGYSIRISYDSILLNEIRRVLSDLLLKSDRKILIVDDAAKCICLMHEPQFVNSIDRVKCVELTTRGIRELKKIEIKCPVVDIASSNAKRKLEAPLIGESMVNEFFLLLEKWNPYYKPFNNNILLIGYGTIGREVCSRLKRSFNLAIYDNSSEQIEQANNDGYEAFNYIPDTPFGIIIGCTGTSSIDVKKLSNCSGVLFVNMSSSDLEFGLWKFSGKKMLARNIFNFSLQELPLHELYMVDDNGKIFFIANGGFPIDFTGEIDPIDPKKIQITRALVLSASLQVIDKTDNGIVELDELRQQDIINYFNVINYGG